MVARGLGSRISQNFMESKVTAGEMKPLLREEVEKLAKAIGPNSAAAQALKFADKHSGPCKFYQTQDKKARSYSILVERL